MIEYFCKSSHIRCFSIQPSYKRQSYWLLPCSCRLLPSHVQHSQTPSDWYRRRRNTNNRRWLSSSYTYAYPCRRFDWTSFLALLFFWSFRIYTVTAFTTRMADQRGGGTSFHQYSKYYRTLMIDNNRHVMTTQFHMATKQDEGDESTDRFNDDDKEEQQRQENHKRNTKSNTPNSNPNINNPNTSTNPYNKSNSKRTSKLNKINNNNTNNIKDGSIHPKNHNNHTNITQSVNTNKGSKINKPDTVVRQGKKAKSLSSFHTNKSTLNPMKRENSTIPISSKSQGSVSTNIKNPSITTTNVHDSQQQQQQQVNRLQKRISQLEAIVASQSVEICRLKDKWKELNDAASTFTQVVDILRQAGLTSSSSSSIMKEDTNTPSKKTNKNESSSSSSIEKKNNSSSNNNDETVKSIDSIPKNETLSSTTTTSSTPIKQQQDQKIQDDWEIFGRAPASVMDAADAAGASILAALLAGKHRMLVDVRDAELSRDPETLVQFIELAILPVAAGLEGLTSTRNRVKLVFPTVSQLLQYRKTMALAAPDVVALSTLGFDPVEKRDNLVVIIAPSPDDEDGLSKMNSLLDEIRPPVVILNHHMVPMVGPASQFEQVYLLRLFTVQYMMGGNDWPLEDGRESSTDRRVMETEETAAIKKSKQMNSTKMETLKDVVEERKAMNEEEDDNAALEAAMEHAHELGTHQGMTRAMVIRAYPKPWHIFVDTSPDTDADFEVAATFDECPSQDDINYAIVECLEGSEREDELVAQQMQQALEAGQLNKVSEIFGTPGMSSEAIFGIDQLLDSTDDLGSTDDGLFYDDWDLWKDTDTV